MTKRIAVGADGSGTTFAAIVEACRSGRLPAEVVLLFTNRPQAKVVERAEAFGIPVLVLRGDAAAREEQLLRALTVEYAPIDLVCNAGYLRLVPASVVAAFRNRYLNSHPALDLVRFGGKGMYGEHVAAAVIKAGEKYTGSTIHIVDEQYDHGPIVLQSRELIPVLPDDTPESLLARQLPGERELYLEAIELLLSDKVAVQGD